MLFSTVNNSFHVSFTTLIRVKLCRVIQGLSFVALCAIEITSVAIPALWHFVKVRVFSIGK